MALAKPLSLAAILEKLECQKKSPNMGVQSGWKSILLFRV